MLVSNLWWVCNSSIFEDTFVPPEITTTIMLSQVVEFKEDPRDSRRGAPLFLLWISVPHGVILMERLKAILLNVGSVWFYSLASPITFTSDMLLGVEQIIMQSL